MKKIELSIYIADTLFGKHLDPSRGVNEDNWKVKDLMKKKKAELEDLYKMAKRVRDSVDG